MHPPSFPHEKCPLTPTHPKHTPTHSHQPMKNVHLLSPIQNIPPPRTTTKTSTHKKCPPSASYVKYTSTHPQLSTTTHKICLSIPRSSKAYLHLPSPFMKNVQKYASTYSHPPKIFLHSCLSTNRKDPPNQNIPPRNPTYPEKISSQPHPPKTYLHLPSRIHKKCSVFSTHPQYTLLRTDHWHSHIKNVHVTPVIQTTLTS